MTKPEILALVERLEAASASITKGPYDYSHGLVRAIRGDLALPMLDVREVSYDPGERAPTVRHDGGKVMFRAGTHDAEHSIGHKRAAANGRALLALLTDAPALAAALRRALEERDRLREALEPFADACMHLHPTHPDDGETLDGFTVADFRRASAALAPPGETK